MTTGSTAKGMTRPATVFFLACFAGITYFLYRVFSSFFSILLWAVVLAVVFYPVFKRIFALVRGRRTAAALITCILILLLIVLPLTAVGVLVTQQSIALYQSIQENAGTMGDVTARLRELENRPAVQWLTQHVPRWFGAEPFDPQKYLREGASVVSRFLVDKGPSFLKNVGGMVVSFFLIFITMFFLLRDGPQLMAVIRSTSPLPEAYESELIKNFQDVSYATFFGSLLTAAAYGIAAFLFFVILGLPAPLFWGAIVSLASLVPIVGTSLVWIPWAAYLVLAGQTTRGIILLTVGSLVIGSIDNVLKPMIIQGRTDVHPLLVFFSVLGGLQAFGFLGILLGPLVVVLFISFLNFYRLEFHESLRHKQPVAEQESGVGSQESE